LGYWLLNEGVDWLDWVSMAVIFTGLGLFFMDELSFSGFWGNIMALCGGVCFALFTVILRKQKSKLSYEIIFFGNLLTALISLPILIQVMPEIQTLIGEFLWFLALFNWQSHIFFILKP